MATNVNEYKNDSVNGHGFDAADWNHIADGSELHHVNLCELFGAGVIGASDWNIGIVAGQIALTITAGQGIVGDAGERKVCATESSVTITSTQGIGASNTYYIFKKRDLGTVGDDATGFVGQLSSTAPADSILIGTAVFNGTEATSVDVLPQGRVNLRNPITLSGLAADRPTFGVVGRFYFATDTAGGTLYYDTGAAWQTVAAPAGGGTFTGAVVIQPATDVLPLQIVIPSGASGATGYLDIVDNTLASLSRFASSQLTMKPASTGSSFYEAYGWGTSLTIGMITRGAGGSRGSETDVAINQVNGRWAATGWGGSAYRFGGYIYCKASEAFGSGAAGSRWEIHTAPIGSVTPAEAMRIASAGVNIGGAANNGASAIFQVDSTTQGALIPRMTTAQRDAISSPAAGLAVIDSDLNAVSLYGTRWKWTPGVLYMQTADGTLNTSAAETTIVGTGQGSMVLPASFWKVGKTLRFKMSGYYGDTGTPTLRFKFNLDGVNMLDSGSITLPSAITGKQFVFEGEITCRTVGGSGTVRAAGQLRLDTTLYPLPGLADVTVNTTQSDTADITGQWGTSSPSNALVSTNLTLEVLP